MALSRANPGFGVKFLIGDGGIGAGVQASVEWGTTTAKIRIKRRYSGTSGNGKNVTVVVSGASYINTAIDANQVSITAPTTATVAQVIAYLLTQPNFVDYWTADYGATPGDGTGVITARTVTATSGGTDGTEIFTEIGELVGVPGIGTTHRTDEVTHMSSPGGWAEYIGLGVKEGKTFTLPFNFVADDPQQIAIYRTRLESGVKANYRIQFTDVAATKLTFSAIANESDINHERDSRADASYSFQPSGPYSWS